MTKTQKLEIGKIESELMTLSGGLRGLGMAMSTLGAEGEDLSISKTQTEDFGYLVESIGSYTERLSAELDEALSRRSFND